MNKRIMIVDDEPDILMSLRIFFENNNYDVITVKNGFDCINELKKGFKGIVLMDIMMPKMDGWATIKKIVEKGLMKNIAIQIITGKGTEDHDKITGLEPYIHDYLAKPFNPDELILNVDNLYFKLFSNNSTE
ncbi:MAG: response regulator [Candidatus Thermoplasmatota archaeon]|nr:response regulator [Candidatus Thermoplasmatota archaeon]